MNITVFGAGYVGLVSAVCFAEHGHQVCCMDVDADKIARLSQGELPFYEEGLQPLLERHLAQDNLYFTTDIELAVQDGDILFIAVGTPSQADGQIDLRYIRAVAEHIVEYRTENGMVVVKSTVVPGTCDELQAYFGAALRARNADITLSVASNPEFLQEGMAIQQCLHPDRIVVGTADLHVADRLRAVYADFLTDPNRFLVMSTRSAELAKYASNALLATKISFMNEMSRVAEGIGADINEVRSAMSLDPRIGPHFLNAGCGFGGSCFPKDVSALAYLARQRVPDFTPVVLDAVLERNDTQRVWLAEKVKHIFGINLRNKTFALWGLSFKPNTDDIREASSVYIIDTLLKAGATLQVHDPLAMPMVQARYPEWRLHYVETPEAALAGAEALIIVTEWPVYRNFSLRTIKNLLKEPWIFDGRNIYDPKTTQAVGLRYIGIGRGI
ncbi:MAG: hypothetical protein A3J38_00085 [Gammaproteobacteria bacterium RIFCSPHIGHO2_12_FULL_45_9]|nr:MAG: hypothetical protein A3J38_00085 [Gammaproteobacteria bacterium RIFCSPHIGHO2_12_FULL_45_9]